MIDRHVIGLARRGDRDALGLIWREYQPALLRFLGAIGVPDAADVASEVWIGVARALPGFEGNGDDLKMLIFTIGRRRGVDGHRRRARRPEHLVDEFVGRAEPVAPDEFEYVDALARAQAMLAGLPSAQAEVVALRVVAQLSAAEVAAITGRSENAVRVMAMRALRTLRTQMEQEEMSEAEVTPPEPRAMEWCDRIP